MNLKTKGYLTSVGVTVLLIIFTFVVSAIVAGLSNDEWAGLGAAIMMFMATGVIMIGLLVVGIVKYVKHSSQFGLGLIYGISGILIAVVGFIAITSVYNMLV